MGNVKKVVVQGGGKNLYEVSESGGWFYAYQITVGLFNKKTSVGKGRTMEDALSLIKAHSGRGIEKIG
jgi:hypothetical protein